MDTSLVINYDYEAQVRNFSVWSNFIYFLTGFYTLILAFKLTKSNCYFLYKYIFYLSAILIFLTGIFSILYHTHTPSFTQNRHIINNPVYEEYLNYDQGFALTTSLYSILILIIVICLQYKFFKQNRIGIECCIFDLNLWLAILFIILSIVFYVLGGAYTKQSLNCKRQKCFKNRIDGYDIFHSNWHIFTGISLLFFNTFVYNIVVYNKK